MARFFIDRPVFAWVVALFILLGGALSIPLLPVAQYPVIAPPQIALSTACPGASVESLYTGTTRLIEDELNGAANILSFESTTDSFGSINITATFQPGTDPALASVEVQNRLKRVEARLPAEVRQNGILVEEASAATLNIITLVSTDGKMDEIGLGDFLIRNVINEIRRIPGVGRATLYSTERSLRVWVDPDKLRGLSLTQPEHPDRLGGDRRAAEPGQADDHRAHHREGAAQHGGGFRRHRAPGQPGRLQRAPA